MGHAIARPPAAPVQVGDGSSMYGCRLRSWPTAGRRACITRSGLAPARGDTSTPGRGSGAEPGAAQRTQPPAGASSCGGRSSRPGQRGAMCIKRRPKRKRSWQPDEGPPRDMISGFAFWGKIVFVTRRGQARGRRGRPGDVCRTVIVFLRFAPM
jgi:hypothetical protein